MSHTSLFQNGRILLIFQAQERWQQVAKPSGRGKMWGAISKWADKLMKLILQGGSRKFSFGALCEKKIIEGRGKCKKETRPFFFYPVKHILSFTKKSESIRIFYLWNWFFLLYKLTSNDLKNNFKIFFFSNIAYQFKLTVSITTREKWWIVIIGFSTPISLCSLYQ